MKSLFCSGQSRPCVSGWLSGCATAIAMAATPLYAEVAVFFNNTGLLNTSPADLGTVTLAFTVDGSGNVTLDASTTGNAAAVTAVNAWDGPVGTISHPGAFNSSFTLTMTGLNPQDGTSKNLRLVDVIATGSTGGLVGVQGVNQFRIDDSNAEAIRFAAAAVPIGSKLKVTSMDWRNSTGPSDSPTQRAFSDSPAIDVTNVASTVTGTWDLSASGLLLGSAESFAFGTIPSGVVSRGYSLGALRFDIVNASALIAPTGLTATTNGSQVVLDWNDALNATSYSVFRSTTAGGPYDTAVASGLATSAYTDTTVSTGSTYYYVVTASDASSESGNSNEAFIAVKIPAPTGLTRIQGDGVMNLDWADSTSPIFASYSVYRSGTSGGPYTSIATGLTASEYSDTTVTNGTVYYYVVRAVDNVVAAESADSAQVSGAGYAPISGSSLYAHLDASDAASVTADASDVVSLWADRTANGLNASSVNGVGLVYYPSLSLSDSGLEGVEVGYHPSGSPKSMLSWFTTAQQAQWLDFDSGAGALPYGGFTVFAVVHPDAILAGTARDVVMASTENEFMLRYENGRPQLRLGNTLIQGAAGVVVTDETVVLAVNYNAATGDVQLWNSQNGVITTGNVPARNFSSTTRIFLGGSANPDQYMKGMIGEVKVYRGVMSASEFLSERANLVEKWVGEPVPSNLVVTPQTSSIDLEWTQAVPFLAYTYNIYRSESPDGPFELLAGNLVPTGDNEPQTYSDTTAVAGKTYYYQVTSKNTATNEESTFSTQVSGSLIAPVLYAHLTSQIPSSITADENETVTVWADQTANGFNATSEGGAGTVFYPSESQSDSGLVGLEMGNTPGQSTLQWFTPEEQDQWLNFSSEGAALDKGGFAVLAVVHPDQILGGSNRDVMMSSREGEFALRYEQGRPQVRLGVASETPSPTILQGPAGAVTAGRTVVLAVSYDAATGSLKLWDSNSRTTVTTTVTAADFSSPAPMFLGGSQNPDQYMRGMLGEVKLYTGIVSETDLINEAKSMVVDWGLPELTWTGAESSEWSTNVLPGLKNWSAYGPVARDFASTSAVIFDGTAANQTVEITGADVTPWAVAFNSGIYTLQGSNKIASGPVTVAAGATLKLGSSNILPDGAGNGNLTVNGILDLNGNSDTINALTGNGSVDNTAATTTSTLTVGANAGGTFAGSLKNTGGTLALTKTGATDLILTGSNTYSGATTVNQNRLFITGLQSFSPNTAVTVDNNASFVLNVPGTGTPTVPPTFAQSITLNSGSNFALRQAATLGNVTLPASGSVRLNFDDVATQGISLPSAQTLSGSLDVQVGGGTGTAGNVTLNGIIGGEGGSLVKTGPGRLILRGANTFDGGVIIKNGTLESQAVQTTLGSGTVTMGGTGSTGVTYLTGQSNSNPFVIDAPDSGAVVIGANGAGSGFTLSGGITLNGNLTLQTFNNTIPVPPATTRASATLTGGITGTGNLVLNNLGLAANTLIFNTNAINHTGSLTLQGTATGNTEINVPIGANVTGITQNSATSTLVLSGANTYASNLTVNAGTVRISNNSNTANDASTVTVAATGATLNLTYSGTDRVASLVIGTETQPKGVYGRIDSTDPSVTHEIPQITGDGTLSVGAPEIAVEQGVDTVIANGGSQGFGMVEAGSSTELTFTIRNSGDIPLKLTGTPAVAISGGNSADFTVTAQPTGPVAAGSTTTFTVQFAPSAEGARSAVLTINNDDNDEGSYVINLTGTGIGGTTPSDPFAEWSGDLAFDDDANGDGVSNGLAWILGAADPNANALGLLPTVSTTATNMVFTFKRTQASINDSTALSVEVGTTLAAWPATYTVGADTEGSSEGVAIAKDSPSEGTDTVTVTIPRDSNTKLFARLKAAIEDSPAE